MASPPLFNTFVILSATLALLTPSFASSNLYTGESLKAGQALTEGTYFLVMQKDCDLVLYDMGSKVWSTGTAGKGQNCRLDLQRDGNLVIYTPDNKPVWATNTDGHPGNHVLVMQKDRNIVLYGPTLWHAGTVTVGSAINITIAAGKSTGPVVINGDEISMVTDHSEK